MIKTLLIEDNKADALLLKVWIAKFNLNLALTWVKTLQEGLRHLKADNYNLVISDLNLDDSTGFDTFCQIHQKFPKIPIVILSGESDEALALRAVREGAQDYIVKGKMAGAYLNGFSFMPWNVTRQVKKRKRIFLT